MITTMKSTRCSRFLLIEAFTPLTWRRETGERIRPSALLRCVQRHGPLAFRSLAVSESPPGGENVRHKEQRRNRAKGSTCLLRFIRGNLCFLALAPTFHADASGLATFSRLLNRVLFRCSGCSGNLLTVAQRGVCCPGTFSGLICAAAWRLRLGSCHSFSSTLEKR